MQPRVDTGKLTVGRAGFSAFAFIGNSVICVTRVAYHLIVQTYLRSTGTCSAAAHSALSFDAYRDWTHCLIALCSDKRVGVLYEVVTTH